MTFVIYISLPILFSVSKKTRKRIPYTHITLSISFFVKNKDKNEIKQNKTKSVWQINNMHVPYCQVIVIASKVRSRILHRHFSIVHFFVHIYASVCVLSKFFLLLR